MARRRTKGWKHGVLAAAAMLWAGCHDTDALDGLPAGREGRVTAVLAGDVIALDGGEQVKLAGVEAPHGDEPYAQAAKEALARLVTGRRVALFFSGARKDELGRTVAQVEDADDRRWIEAALLDMGAARVRTAADDRAAVAALLAREAVARRARKGLWVIPAYEVRLPEEVGPGDDGFMVVEGRVRRVGSFGGGTYMDFGDDWRSTVSVVIARDALRDFQTLGLDPFDLEGRLIRVRGMVSRGRLRVDHPEQIERLSN